MKEACVVAVIALQSNQSKISSTRASLAYFLKKRIPSRIDYKIGLFRLSTAVNSNAFRKPILGSIAKGVSEQNIYERSKKEP